MADISQKRIPQLDLLRAIAVLLVMGNHLTICPPETNLYLNKFTEFWSRGGWIGVDLFFVLSGFLVSGLLFREYQKQGSLDIKRFLIRRGFKIYPAFWVLIAVTCVAGLFTDVHFYRLGFYGELLFLQNYIGNLWEHTWTLAVEEHFYIGLCILFYFFLRRKKRVSENPFSRIPRIFALIAVACLAMRLLTEIYEPFQYERNIEPTHLRIDSLFFGVLISYLWHFKGLSENEFLTRHKSWFGIAGVALLLQAFLFDVSFHAWVGIIGLSMFYLGGGFLLLFFLKTDFSKVPSAGAIAYLGTFSYSIYLWNLPVHKWLTKAVPQLIENGDWPYYFTIYFIGTLVIGIGMAKLVEYPFLKLRNKYFPTLSPPLAKNVEE